MAAGGVRTLAVLDHIDRTQMMVMTRETSNHCLGYVRGRVEISSQNNRQQYGDWRRGIPRTEAECRTIIGV